MNKITKSFIEKKLRMAVSAMSQPDTDRDTIDNLSSSIMDELLRRPTEQNIKIAEHYTPEPEKVEYIKAGLHAEKLKFGNKPEKPYQQVSIIEMLENSNKPEESKEKDIAAIKQHNITIAGIDYSLAQNKALHSIQSLLSKTNYKGNRTGENIDYYNEYGFTGYIPKQVMAVPEYLDTYGVTKKDLGRGKLEYNPKERKDALEALSDLNKVQVFIQYDRKRVNEKGETITEKVVAVKNLIAELNFVNSEGTEEDDTGRLLYIEFMPSFVLVDQIDKYFVLKPKNLYQELKQRFNTKDQALFKFIEYLIVQAKERTANMNHTVTSNDLTFKLYFETLAYKLNLGYLVETRNTKSLGTRLKGYFEKAKILGYIAEYSIEEAKNPKDNKATYTLNSEKVYLPELLKEGRSVTAATSETAATVEQ